MNQAVDALLSLSQGTVRTAVAGPDSQTVEALLNPVPLALRRQLAPVYRQAANRIDQWGWIQRVAIGPKGETCMGNAVVRSAWELTPLGCAIAIEVLRAWIGTSHPAGIEKWNDAPERTKDEVVKTLRALADYLTTPPEAYLG